MPEFIETKTISSAGCRVGKENNRAESNCGLYDHIRGVNVSYGSVASLTAGVKAFVEESVALCQPAQVHICDGSDIENKMLLRLMLDAGTIVPLPKYENCWLARTNAADVARVEGRTFICTDDRAAAIPTPAGSGTKGTLGNWMSPAAMDAAVQERFPGCMSGRTMYVVPFSMGPVGSRLAKIGIELTDSPYVVASMRIMTRMGAAVLEHMRKVDHDGGAGGAFVRALHSVGCPADGVVECPAWPCDPQRTIILHRPDSNTIVSYGSGYGGNSLLGKKCFALRIGSTLARREGWLAEHMLILGITDGRGRKRYVTAAFPSACGKTNLAMLQPTLAGYKVECVGDDIAWMRFDDAGVLRAINPENGFFGVAPGTSTRTNPIAMATIFRNTIFTNVASTSDGGVYWEGMDMDEGVGEGGCLADGVHITDWRGRPWTKAATTPAAHPNARFCTPAAQCPIIDAAWERAEGVPISAILFGGRRPTGVPLIYEARSWTHGVLMGAAMRSEATAAAEHTAKVIMHDPFAMRPFFGYNFGHYVQHWLDVGARHDVQLPKIFHVNWFRRDASGQRMLWPGYGDNVRVLEWILRRIDGERCYMETAIGRMPAAGQLNVAGLRLNGDGDGDGEGDLEALFSLPKDFWQQEVQDIRDYFESQVGADLPAAIYDELEKLRERIEEM